MIVSKTMSWQEVQVDIEDNQAVQDMTVEDFIRVFKLDLNCLDTEHKLVIEIDSDITVRVESK